MSDRHDVPKRVRRRLRFFGQPLPDAAFDDPKGAAVRGGTIHVYGWPDFEVDFQFNETGDDLKICSSSCALSLGGMEDEVRALAAECLVVLGVPVPASVLGESPPARLSKPFRDRLLTSLSTPTGGSTQQAPNGASRSPVDPPHSVPADLFSGAVAGAAASLERLLEKNAADVAFLAATIRDALVVPVCRSHRLRFVSGMGTFFFEPVRVQRGEADGNTYGSSDDLKNDRRLSEKAKEKLGPLLDLLNESVSHAQYLGFFVEDFDPQIKEGG